MTYLAIAAMMVALNGFFVAAEFALVKVRGSQLEALVKQRRPFAKTAHWLGTRLDASLSACQLGITMASLALGWVGEPAFAALLEPAFRWIGVTSDAALHTFSFIIAFSIITALHLVVGEQVPKIYAIRRPEIMLIWCAVPLLFFYVLLYPFLVALSYTTSVILKVMGIDSASGHDAPHSEDEIRTLVRQSHTHGHLTKSEQQLIHAVFEFDDMICRRVMVPRSEVVYVDIKQSFTECLEIFKRTKHTRYPLRDESLDNVVGIIHIKDLIGLDPDNPIDLRDIARPPHHVPETMPISMLLRHFQKTHQLLALVVDEHGTVVGIVSLENVLEQIVGELEDEFDTEPPDITRDGQGRFTILGGASLELVNEKLGLNLEADDVDTLAGVLVERLGRLLHVGDKVDLDGATAEVLEADGVRAKRIRVTMANAADPSKK